MGSVGNAKRIAKCDDRSHSECEFLGVVSCPVEVGEAGTMKAVAGEWVQAIDSKAFAACAPVCFGPIEFCCSGFHGNGSWALPAFTWRGSADGSR